METLLKKLIIQKSFRSRVEDFNMFNVSMSIQISTNDKEATYNLTKDGYFEISQICAEFNQFLVFPKIQEPPETCHTSCQTDADIQVSKARLEKLDFVPKFEPVDDFGYQGNDIEITEMDDEESDEDENDPKRPRIDNIEEIAMEEDDDDDDNEFAGVTAVFDESDTEEQPSTDASTSKTARRSERERRKPTRFNLPKPQPRVRQEKREEVFITRIETPTQIIDVPPSMSAPITVHLRRSKRRCAECMPKRTRCRVFCDNCNSAICKEHRYIICRSCGERLLQSTPNRVYQMKPLNKLQ